MKKTIIVIGFILIFLGSLLYILMMMILIGVPSLFDESFIWLVNINSKSSTAFSYLPFLAGIMIFSGAWLLKDSWKN